MGLREKMEKEKERVEDDHQKPETNEEMERNHQLFQSLKLNLQGNSKMMDLLKSYIATDMDKRAIGKHTFDQELTEIKDTSKEIQLKLKTLLQEQMKRLIVNKETLEKVLNDSTNHMSQNNEKTIQQLSIIQSQLNTQLGTIQQNMQNEIMKMSDHVQTEISSMTKKANQSLEETAQKTSTLVWNARKGVLLNEWIDVLKYSGSTAVLVGAVVYGLSFFELI